jgi:Spy/CpxP family protein refolding chaperone
MFQSDRPSWQNPKVLTTLVLVFVAGALTGALGMRVGLHDRLHPSNASLSKPDSAKLFLNRCQKELDLTPQQAEQMRTILDDYKLYYQSLQDQYESLQGQLEEVRATGKSRILAVLNEQQKAKFEKLLTQMK